MVRPERSIDQPARCSIVATGLTHRPMSRLTMKRAQVRDLDTGETVPVKHAVSRLSNRRFGMFEGASPGRFSIGPVAYCRDAERMELIPADSSP